MSANTPCVGVQERLIEALLAHDEAAAPDLAHSESCDACRTLRDDLLHVRAGLGTDAEQEPAPAVVQRTLLATRSALRRRAPARAPLPAGFKRELARLLAAPLAVLPLVLLWNWTVLAFGGELLAAWLPTAAIVALGAAYALAAGGSLAAVFGSLPVVAHQRTQQRLREVTA